MADATTTDGSFPDIAGMRYEDAREELIAIVAKLEAGQAPLEDSMQLWRRGEALAAHCATWLDGAQAEIEQATVRRPPRGAPRRRRHLRRGRRLLTVRSGQPVGLEGAGRTPVAGVTGARAATKALSSSSGAVPLATRVSPLAPWPLAT